MTSFLFSLPENAKKSGKTQYNVSDNKKYNEGSILLDELNLKIIKDMMNDADVKNTSLAKRYKSPLSTIQRRRTRLERTILKKRYNMDIRNLGWRQADLLISVRNGNSEEMARKIMSIYRSNLIAVSLRIGDPEINLIAQTLKALKSFIGSLKE